MATAFRCPQCGSVLKDDSRFCNYCGAKIDDGTKRIEVKIDKRIEDVAEVRRVSYEEQESLLRQKKMKKELRKGKVKWIVCGSLVLLGFLLAFLGSGGRGSGMFAFYGVILIAGVPIYLIIDFLK